MIPADDLIREAQALVLNMGTSVPLTLDDCERHSDVEVALILHQQLLDLQKAVTSLRSHVETWCVQRMTYQVHVPGVGLAVRRGGVDHKEWDNQGLAYAIAADITQGDLSVAGPIVDALLAVLPKNPDWKVTPLKEWGKDEDGVWRYLDYCKTVPGRASIQWQALEEAA